MIGTPPELASWAPLVGERSAHQAGALLSLPEGDGRLHVVQSGLVRLYHIDGAGNERTLRRVEAGGLFGEEALVGRSRLYVAEALLPSVICSFSSERLSAQERASVTVALAEALRHNRARLGASLGKKIRVRLAWELLDLARTPLGKRNDLEQVCLGLTHEALAGELGVTRETITRTLGELAEVGAVALGAGEIVILDELMLRVAAHEAI